MKTVREDVAIYLHEAAVRTARRCRYVIQAVLREEEWSDADREFYRIAREEMERLAREIPGTGRDGGGR